MNLIVQNMGNSTSTRLYIIGAGDLGTTAAELNDTLERTFDIATSWKAIVLIDEVST